VFNTNNRQATSHLSKEWEGSKSRNCSNCRTKKDPRRHKRRCNLMTHRKRNQTPKIPKIPRNPENPENQRNPETQRNQKLLPPSGIG